ncbi:MAG: 50S ribosomal protein L22 [Deferribacteraceae bacterium]|jgi:large subunit ribosomal protein L22|nr:50S ribosomal protein L22 [Deferribacteraceae bacterium]
MFVRAKAMYVRVSTRKSREVADLVRGKKVEDALRILKFIPRKGAFHIAKAIRSAAANAEENLKVRDLSNVYVSDLRIEMGPPQKRFMPRAHGRASLIRKPTTHIKVVLMDKEG